MKKPNDRKTPKIPADLVDMQRELQIDPRGICALLGQCKATGHRLQDVYKVKRQQLLNAGALGGRAVAYLRYLLTCGDDFSYIARTRSFADGLSRDSRSNDPSPLPHLDASTDAPAATPADGRNSDDEQLRVIAQAARFKRFRHVQKHITVRMYDCSADVTQDGVTAMYGGWDMMVGLYRGIRNGKLVPVDA